MLQLDHQHYPRQPVPPRALGLSLAALGVPVAGGLLFPDSLRQYGAMLWLLALVPAFLLTYYRGWRGVATALAGGMALLSVTHVVGYLLGKTLPDRPIVFLVVAAYIGITIGIGGLAEVLRDVAAQRRAAETLRRLQTALETMQLGITITGLQGKIIYANPTDAKMHGYTVEDLIGEDVGIYAPAARRAPLTLEQLMQLTRRNRESVNVRKDGSVFPVQLRSDVVMGVDGEPIGVVTSCEDITERKRAEDQLQGAYRELRQSHLDLQATQEQLIEAEKLESIGQLAAGVAHEVKNPLMTLLTGVKFLSKFLPDQTEQVTHLLADMSDAISRADSVIKGLLDFSAPRKLDRSPEDLNAIVERSLSLVKHELDRSQVTVVKELAKDIPPLLLDSFKIQQVLVNTVTNAVHATPPGGTVTTRTSVRPLRLISGGTVNDAAGQWNTGERAVFLEVEDTGSGIPDEKLSKIFDPFFTTKPAGKGTGLGLSVVRQIVEMHGASIDIRNGNEGGVIVTIVFKLETNGRDDGKKAHPAR